MRILLDSSFFFPLIKIKIKESLNEIIPSLIKSNSFELQYSTITLFELSAKGARLINVGELTELEVVNGMNALISWESLLPVNPWLGEIQRLAFTLRNTHSDYIDCLILASAVVHMDMFICEDKTLRNLVKTKWLRLIADINPNFSVMSSKQVKNWLVKDKNIKE